MEPQYLESSSLPTSTKITEQEHNDMQIRQMISNGISSMNGSEDIRFTAPIIHSENNPLINSENHNVTQTTTFFIVKKIWLWICSIFITFVVCLSIFPSIAALVDSTEKGKVFEMNILFIHTIKNLKV